MDTYNSGRTLRGSCRGIIPKSQEGKSNGRKEQHPCKRGWARASSEEAYWEPDGRTVPGNAGHVVRADGMKSGQMDIIIVRDVPAATMHKTEEEKLSW